MASPLARAVKSHHTRLQAAAGLAVVYLRTATGQELEITAVPGNHLAQNDGIDIEEISFDEYDWLIDVELLDFEDGQQPPARGDVITADGQSYEVMPRLESQPWRYTDSTRQVYRIFTVEIVHDGT